MTHIASHGKIHHAIKNGKPSIKMAIFNSYVTNYQRVHDDLPSLPILPNFHAIPQLQFDAPGSTSPAGRSRSQRLWGPEPRAHRTFMGFS